MGRQRTAGADLRRRGGQYAAAGDALRLVAALLERRAPAGSGAPAVVHFCQRYPAGGQKFGKHSVPHNAFSCDGGVFAFDAGKAAAAAIGAGSREAVRNAYVLCNVLPRLQAAQLAYKRDVCPKRGLATWNEARTMHA